MPQCGQLFSLLLKCSGQLSLGFNNLESWKGVAEICTIPCQQPLPAGCKCADKNVRHGTPDNLALPIEGDLAFPSLMRVLRVLPIPGDRVLNAKSFGFPLANIGHPLAGPPNTPELGRIPKHGRGAGHTGLGNNHHPAFVVRNRFPCHALSGSEIESFPDHRRDRHLPAICHHGCHRFHTYDITSCIVIMSILGMIRFYPC